MIHIYNIILTNYQIRSLSMIRKITAIRNLQFCYSLSTIIKYKPYLSKHLYSILEKDNLQYSNIQPFFHQISSHASTKQSELKSKFNIIYNCNNIRQPSLAKYSQLLSRMVIQDKLKSQEQLDKIVNWLRTTVKHNKQIGQSQIDQLLSQMQEQQINQSRIFQQQLKQVVEEQQKQLETEGHNILGCISKICKKMRNKFIAIDSQYIFDKVSKICHQRSIRKQPQNQIKTVDYVTKRNNHFWDKIGSIKPRILEQECNSKQIYEQHLKITDGIKRFRFPPEPNGHLHIGHVKAMRINFETASRLKGHCYLRFDDTNPQTQSHEYIQEIENNVKWLGYSPNKITFASDYFEQMLHYANQLIRNGNAYVCQSSSEQMESQRWNKKQNPYRNRPISQNLKIFPNLSPGQTLRLKGDPVSVNPTLRDPVIYRLKSSTKPHPRTGNRYSIYPIYDFAHCTSDSIEHIDYSLCSLQFQVRRQLYYRYLHLLGLYKPNVWQYSRLNIEGNVLSKRKIKALIENKTIENWDDPRLLTIRGLQRRGYTPLMLKQFIDKVNSSRAGNQNIVQANILERQMKKQLYKQARKTMAVIRPVSAIIKNYSQLTQKTVQIGQYTTQSTKKSQRILKISQNIEIQKLDFTVLQEKQFIILKYFGIFQVQEKKIGNQCALKLKFICKIDQTSKICSLALQAKKLRKLHWISADTAKKIDITFFQKLFKQDGILNQQSKTTVKGCLIQANLLQHDDEYWQFQRVGYFKWDRNPNSKNQEMIRCCSL